MTQMFAVPGQHHQHKKVLEQQARTLMVVFWGKHLCDLQMTPSLCVHMWWEQDKLSWCPFVWALFSSWGPPHKPTNSESYSSKYHPLEVEDSSTGVYGYKSDQRNHKPMCSFRIFLRLRRKHMSHILPCSQGECLPTLVTVAAFDCSRVCVHPPPYL